MALIKQHLKTKPVCKVTFTLSEQSVDPEAKEVKVVGEFNDWNWRQGVTMKKKNGEYQAAIKLERGREYQFRYLVDNEVWVNDWYADRYVATPFGEENSVVHTYF